MSALVSVEFMASLAAKAVCEFVGTFLLVLAAMYTNFGSGGLPVGLTLMVLVYSFGPISGAHLNPAVSTTILATKNIDIKDYGVYVVSQLLGASVAGSLLLSGILGDVPLGGSVGNGDLGKALMVEFFFSLMLCEVVLHVAVADDSQGKQYFGMAIGFVLTVGAECVGGISGACFNPAVVLGFLFQSKSFPWTWFGSYIVVELLAACLAAFLFKFKINELNELGRLSKLCEHVYARSAMAEVLGTFFLVLAICLSPDTKSPDANLHVFIIGAALTTLVYTYANISGSHFNPAVTVVMFINGALELVEVYNYILAQTVGACLAYWASHHIKGGECKAVNGKGENLPQEILGEFFGTFVLVFTICSVTKSDYLSENFGWAIGMSLVAGAGSPGVASGGSLNPVLTFAAYICNPLVKYIWYIVGEMAGAVAAWAVFKFLNSQPSKGNEFLIA